MIFNAILNRRPKSVSTTLTWILPQRLHMGGYKAKRAGSGGQWAVVRLGLAGRMWPAAKTAEPTRP